MHCSGPLLFCSTDLKIEGDHAAAVAQGMFLVVIPQPAVVYNFCELLNIAFHK